MSLVTSQASSSLPGQPGAPAPLGPRTGAGWAQSLIQRKPLLQLMPVMPAGLSDHAPGTDSSAHSERALCQVLRQEENRQARPRRLGGPEPVHTLAHGGEGTPDSRGGGPGPRLHQEGP